MGQDNGKQIWIGWESPAEEVKEPLPWEQVKGALEERILKARFKDPFVGRISIDGVSYITLTFKRNGKEETYGEIADNHEDGVNKIYERIISTRIVGY